LRLKLSIWQVWLVDRGCLLLHGTWSHLWYIERSLFVLFS
jgi:hypothetical protein